MNIKLLLAPVAAGFALVSTLHASSFADAVIAYNPGTMVPASKYTNSSAVLGQPAITNKSGAITPFNPPSLTNQILSLATNGSLTVRFDPPIVRVPNNPFGLDFLVFGNSFLVKQTNGTASGQVFHDACQATVSVSSDGVTFYRLNPALAPQLNDLYPTDGSGNFHRPVNPGVTDFTNLTLAGIRALYNGSAGGVGYSISWAQDEESNSVSLFEVSYIRVDVQSGQALISGFAAVENTNQVIVEDFSHNPALDGWKIFGDTNLFAWDSTNQNLKVVWDSSQPNSYFYYPLVTTIGRSNDFSMSFDLLLNDYAIGVNPSQPDTFEVATGFLNFAEATGTNFFRGGYPSQPDLAEFDFFQWDNDFSTNSVDPTFVDSSNTFANSLFQTVELPLDTVMRVTMNYTASNQTAILTITTNGAALTPPTPVNLTDSTYGVFGDFRVDTFAVESYSDAEAYGSLLAHGTIGNVLIVVPPPVPVLQVALNQGVGQVQFASQTNWNYSMQSSTNLQTWLPAGPLVGGTAGNLILRDTNSAQQYQFYRVGLQKAGQ